MSIPIQVSCSRTWEPKYFDFVSLSYLYYAWALLNCDLVGGVGVPRTLYVDIVNGTVHEIGLIPQVLRVVSGEVDNPNCRLADC